MTKHLLAGVAAVVLMSSAALAQTYPPAPPTPGVPIAPPPSTPIPEIPAPASGTVTSTTTTVAPTMDGGYRTSTTKQGVDEYGNPVSKKDIYKEGVSGSSETHSRTETDPSGAGTTTHSTTTTTRQ
jgi:hypothetical protein